VKKYLLALFVVSLSFSIAAAQTNVTLMQLAKLTDANGTAYEQYGTYSALSGSTAIVGRYDPAGVLDVFVKGASGWVDTPSATLAGSDGAVGLTSVAISGTTVVAAGFDSLNQTASTYIFERPTAGWSGTVTETAILGISGYVGISGNTIVVGSGAFYYVFVKPSGGWKNTSQPNATLNAPVYGYFSSFAIEGNTIVLGASENFGNEGTVYLFVKPNTGWSGTLNPTATLIASNGRPNDALGSSVAVSGNTVVAGATGVNADFGAVYVFVQPVGGWKDAYETAELMAPNTIELGWSVGISGNAIVTGAPDSTVGFNQDQGAVYLYVKPSGGWKTTSTPNAELTSSDGAANDLFGSRALISGSTILATAPQATVNSNYVEGAAYVFGK
jgi:hypothetical protein